MGVIVTKENSKSTSLNDRISAELRSKAVATEFLNEDGSTVSTHKKTKKTAKFSWFWLVLIVLAVISGSFIVLF